MIVTPEMRSLLLTLGILIVAGAFAYAADAVRGALRPEVAFFKEHSSPSFGELSRFFEELAREKGALYAYGVLRKAVLPPNTDMHLLAHVVGDALYKERGVAAIAECTPEFRNACSHSVVIGVFTDEGEAGFSTIASACRKAPGGIGAYDMCFHGLGHGIFAQTNYDLPRAVAICRKTEAEALGGREYVECVGGIIMELVGGMGGHDPEAFARAQERYLSEKDPLSPCDTRLIPARAKSICYLYVTPRLFTHDGGDLGRPGAREFRQAFALCERIPRDEPQNRRACFEGIGKEFPTLAQERDIRRIDELSGEKLARVASWCALGESAEAIEACTRSVVESLFWGGENDPRAAVSFCGTLADVPLRGACYDEVVSANHRYNALDTAAQGRVCALLPLSLLPSCRSGASATL